MKGEVRTSNLIKKDSYIYIRIDSKSSGQTVPSRKGINLYFWDSTFTKKKDLDRNGPIVVYRNN